MVHYLLHKSPPPVPILSHISLFHATPSPFLKIHSVKFNLFNSITILRDLLDTELVITYEGRLISNAHTEISRKRDHVFKQMKVGSKVQYFSYKLTYLIFYIVALSFNTFFPT